MRSTRWAVLMSFGQRESWQDRSCLPVRRVYKATRLLRLDSFEFMGHDDLQPLADRSWDMCDGRRRTTFGQKVDRDHSATMAHRAFPQRVAGELLVSVAIVRA